MIRRHTRVLAADASGIEAAAEILRAGGLVAFPTETVYGLGANALDAAAAQAIFAAKQRPADDPLIVHLRDVSNLHSVSQTPPRALRLAERFWPGPLTLVVPKRSSVPDVVTAGLASVAVRVPSHPLARALLEATGFPLAAPSANLFGRPSPTHASHVLADLNDRIDAVLDGGPTTVGVESTIVDLTTSPPRLLRPGGISLEDLEFAMGQKLQVTTRVVGAPPSPGLLPVHYAPRTPFTLITGDPPAAQARLIAEVKSALAAGQRVAVLALEDDLELIPPDACVHLVGEWSDPTQSARQLFEALRQLDAENLDQLLARELADPHTGMGRALEDRLRRASRRIITAQ